ncbi:MAG: hypothetical protein E6Q92_03755 [Burkholderiaceae bacterium]|nr:MAG: hypothetical protein E6Q92_03755 [Burkholderiaceae bacterium]
MGRDLSPVSADAKLCEVAVKKIIEIVLLSNVVFVLLILTVALPGQNLICTFNGCSIDLVDTNLQPHRSFAVITRAAPGEQATGVLLIELSDFIARHPGAVLALDEGGETGDQMWQYSVDKIGLDARRVVVERVDAAAYRFEYLVRNGRVEPVSSEVRSVGVFLASLCYSFILLFMTRLLARRLYFGR